MAVVATTIDAYGHLTVEDARHVLEKRAGSRAGGTAVTPAIAQADRASCSGRRPRNWPGS